MSLAARAKAQRVIETPAPGEYHIEKSDKLVVNSAPKFTFGVKKYSGEPNNQTPGNNYLTGAAKCSNSENASTTKQFSLSIAKHLQIHFKT